MKLRILELNSQLSKDISLSFIILVNILFPYCLFPMTKLLPTNSFPFMTYLLSILFKRNFQHIIQLFIQLHCSSNSEKPQPQMLASRYYHKNSFNPQFLFYDLVSIAIHHKLLLSSCLVSSCYHHEVNYFINMNP